MECRDSRLARGFMLCSLNGILLGFTLLVSAVKRALRFLFMSSVRDILLSKRGDSLWSLRLVRLSRCRKSGVDWLSIPLTGIRVFLPAHHRRALGMFFLSCESLDSLRGCRFRPINDLSQNVRPRELGRRPMERRLCSTLIK